MGTDVLADLVLIDQRCGDAANLGGDGLPSVTQRRISYAKQEVATLCVGEGRDIRGKVKRPGFSGGSVLPTAGAAGR